MTQAKAEQIEQRFGPVIARCRSAREPGKVYEVRRHPGTGVYSCNCKGWVFNKTCKHARAADVTEGRSGIVDLASDGTTVVQKIDAMRGAARAAAQQAIREEAERQQARAARPLIVLPAGTLKPRTVKLRKDAPDAIALEAMQAVFTLASWGPLPVRTEKIAQLIEASIRKFAGSAIAQAAPLQAERGVREIILED